MKIIPLSILSIALSISSIARENPFEPTDHFLEQKEMMIQANRDQKIEKEKIVNETKLKELANLESKNEMLKKLKEEQKIEKSLLVNPDENTQKSYVPDIKENFKVLPFVKIYIVNNVLTIKVDTKYKLLNQDILKPNKKLLFDFSGKVSFYTVRKDIISEDFRSFAVGTHMEENFFRVVVDLPLDVIHYIEQIDAKNGTIVIKKK